MKKKFWILILVLSVLFTNQIIVKASNNIETENNAAEGKNEIYSMDEEFDWNIDEILVIYAADDDPFILEAKARGIHIVYQEGIIMPRFTYFSSLSWITRSGVLSLSCSPKNPWTVSLEGSWGEAVRFFQYHPMYTAINNPSKYDSMYNQYKCHAEFARGIKTPWNIEPAKANKSYSDWMTSGCN